MAYVERLPRSTNRPLTVGNGEQGRAGVDLALLNLF